MWALHWTDYVGVSGAALLLWCFIFVDIRMREHDDDVEEPEDRFWGKMADALPLLSHLCFMIGHWRQILGTLTVGAIAVVLLIIGFSHQP
jgi:hypothetical protein